MIGPVRGGRDRIGVGQVSEHRWNGLAGGREPGGMVTPGVRGLAPAALDRRNGPARSAGDPGRGVRGQASPLAAKAVSPVSGAGAVVLRPKKNLGKRWLTRIGERIFYPVCGYFVNGWVSSGSPTRNY